MLARSAGELSLANAWSWPQLHGAKVLGTPVDHPEVIKRAVRMVFEAKDEYDSQWAAIESIAGKIGCTAETLRRWVRLGRA